MSSDGVREAADFSRPLRFSLARSGVSVRSHLVLVDEASRHSPRHVLTAICGVLRVRSRRVVKVSNFNFAKLRR